MSSEDSDATSLTFRTDAPSVAVELEVRVSGLVSSVELNKAEVAFAGADFNCNASKTCSAGPDFVWLSAKPDGGLPAPAACAGAWTFCLSLENAVALSSIVDFVAFDFATGLLGLADF